LSDIDVHQLPSTLRKFIERNPKIWESHEALGLACRKAGPLSDKHIEFIKMAITASQTNSIRTNLVNWQYAQAMETARTFFAAGDNERALEALTAASVAALTVYDMTKALDKGIEIQDVYLLEKTGGKSGDFKRK
jgi:hypothetical protein